MLQKNLGGRAFPLRIGWREVLTDIAARKGVQRLARRILTSAVDPNGKHNPGGWWQVFSEDT